MSRNKLEVYYHFVWTTHGRLPLITDEAERGLYRAISSICQKFKCDVLAVGGMPNHIHLAVTMPSTMTCAKLMQHVKGLTSKLMRDDLTPGEFFDWRDGYGAFTFSTSQRSTVIKYINNQKEHHSVGTIWPNVEAFDDDEE